MNTTEQVFGIALCAVLESVVWLWRLRAGVGKSGWQAGASTGLVCGTRMLFTVVGVNATLADNWMLAGLAYVLAASFATAFAHRLAEKWKPQT